MFTARLQNYFSNSPISHFKQFTLVYVTTRLFCKRLVIKKTGQFTERDLAKNKNTGYFLNIIPQAVQKVVVMKAWNGGDLIFFAFKDCHVTDENVHLRSLEFPSSGFSVSFWIKSLKAKSKLTKNATQQYNKMHTILWTFSSAELHNELRA